MATVAQVAYAARRRRDKERRHTAYVDMLRRTSRVSMAESMTSIPDWYAEAPARPMQAWGPIDEEAASDAEDEEWGGVNMRYFEQHAHHAKAPTTRD